MSSIVEKYNIGETIEYSVKGLENGINRLLEKKDQWFEMGKKEQGLYITQYSWKEMERRINKLYTEVELHVN